MLFAWLCSSIFTPAEAAPSIKTKRSVQVPISRSSKSTSVDFTKLLKVFVQRLVNHRKDSWHAIQSLQMFTPMPLDLLGNLSNPDSWYRRSIESSVPHLQKKWSEIYQNSADTAADGARDMTAGMKVACTADYNRFPPVLCMVKCSSTCSLCVPNPHRCHRVHYLQRDGGGDGDSSWRLRTENMRMIAPDSCSCYTSHDASTVRC